MTVIPCSPPKPPRPSPAQGYLVQKIIACEKTVIPCQYTEWCFDCGDQKQIRSVSPCGTPVWTVEGGHTLCVTLPVHVCLCDSYGTSSIRTAALDIQTVLSRSFLYEMNAPGNTLFLLPGIQLVHAEHTCGGCFRVKLSVSLEAFLLRYEVLCCAPPKPSCPQLPLYPPPMC